MALSELEIVTARGRQARLLEVMSRERLDLVVLSRLEHVQWLTGVRFAWLFEPAAAIWSDGRVVLLAPAKAPENAAADEIVVFEAKLHSTVRNDQRAAGAKTLVEAFARHPAARRVGVEFSCLNQHLFAAGSAELVDIEPEVFRLRRRKDEAELALLRRAIFATGLMYERARELLRPGVSELAVFSALQGVAVECFGEPLTGTGNDYASGARGGPPRRRKIEAGELYILDLGPAYRGYFADTSRTFAVDGEPSSGQLEAWECVAGVFGLIESRARPGVRCRDLFSAVQQHLDGWRPGVFNHHLGHGIGLFPHEAPHLNPHWDEVLEVGDVFTCEPGLYAPELRAGLRLENDYLVTPSGVELLSDFPLEL
jgi:Xaa-Pro dipeptidase